MEIQYRVLAKRTQQMIATVISATIVMTVYESYFLLRLRY